MSTIKAIKFPVFIDCVRDYHEFGVMIDMLKQFGVTGVKYEEMGLSGRDYTAIFYLRKDAEFERMKKKHKQNDD